MAAIQADAAGRIVRFMRAAEEALFPGLHPQAVASLSMDDESNATLVADLTRSTDAYTLAAGVLRKAGVVQTVAADSTAKQDRDGLRSAAAQAVADNNTFLAIATPTAPQLTAQVRALTQQNNRLIKRLVQLTQ